MLEREIPEHEKTYELSVFHEQDLSFVTSQQPVKVEEDVVEGIDFSIVDAGDYREGIHPQGGETPFMRVESAQENLLDDLQPTFQSAYEEQHGHVTEFPRDENSRHEEGETRFLDLTAGVTVVQKEESDPAEEENFSREKDQPLKVENDDGMKNFLKSHNVMLKEDGTPLTVVINGVNYYVIKSSETSESETFELMSNDQFQQLVRSK